ncbi:MAG: glycine--tRNA ligase, partial [Bacteroidales bacterium]|nr:glycine--tRNA ligase [Bacteroidales bacterium]
FSGKKIQYFDPEQNASYTPYDIETSIGVDRTVLAVLSGAYCQEKLENGEERVVMKFHPALAPVKVAVLPLVKKDELTAVAQKIMDELKLDFNCQYEEKDTIGRRYRRQDAIGTPFCVTVDFDSLTDGKVTLRERDTMSQERVSIEELPSIVEKKVSMKRLLEQI